MYEKCIVSTILVMVLASGCISGGMTGSAVNVPQKTIRIGIQTGTANALPMIAKDKGFFDAEGVDVELTEFTAGKFAMQAFLAGDLDMAVSGDVPVTLSSLQGHEFYVLAQVVEKTRNEVRMVALREPDLTNAGDYFHAKRRRVATSFGGGPEFYTYNFLKKYNVTDVEIINQKPEDMPAALATGSVDAVAVFDPYAFFAEEKAQGRAVAFTDDSMYSELYILSAKREWVKSHPDETEKIIRALAKASDYAEKNPEDCKAVVMKYTKLDKTTIDAIWGNFVFKPALNQLLLKDLNAEAEWAIDTGKVKNGTKVPDFMEYIYSDALENVRPQSVAL